MNYVFFLSLEVRVQGRKHLDVIRGRHFLICKKSLLASKEGDLVILSKEGDLNDLSERYFFANFLVREKTAEGDLIVLSKINKKSCLPWDWDLKPVLLSGKQR